MVLYAIRPKEQELLYIFKICARLSAIMFVLGIFLPDWFVDTEKVKEVLASRAETDSTDIGFGCPGLVLFLLLC